MQEYKYPIGTRFKSASPDYGWIEITEHRDPCYPGDWIYVVEPRGGMCGNQWIDDAEIVEYPKERLFNKLYETLKK